MLLQEQITTVAYDTMVTLLCELVAHFQQPGQSGCTGQDWQSESGKTQILIYGQSIALSSALHQTADAIHCEYVLLYDDKHVFSWSEYRWPNLANRHKVQRKSEFCEIPSACLNDLMSYHAQASTQWHKLNCDALERECAA